MHRYVVLTLLIITLLTMSGCGDGLTGQASGNRSPSGQTVDPVHLDQINELLKNIEDSLAKIEAKIIDPQYIIDPGHSVMGRLDEIEANIEERLAKLEAAILDINR